MPDFSNLRKALLCQGEPQGVPLFEVSIDRSIDWDTTLTLGTPDEVTAEVKARLRSLAPGGSYCCSASNSVPEYVPFENYVAMLETVKKYGEYPIRI